MNRRDLQVLVLSFVAAAPLSIHPCADSPRLDASRTPRYATKSISGRVVWMAEAMTRLHGINSVPEASDRMLALETETGELYPIVEDVRGRAFRRDERLRKMKVELIVRKYPNLPTVQIVRVFELAADGKFDVDYWCEICSIAMFELKECECCQGPIEFRRRKVVDPGEADYQRRETP